MFRPLLRAQLVTDVVVAVLFGAIAMFDAGRNSPVVLPVLIVVGFAGALAIRRLSPGLALALAWAFAVLQMATLQYPGLEDAFIAGVMYTTAAYGSRRVQRAGLVSAPVGAVAAAVYIGVRQYAERAAGPGLDRGELVSSGRAAGIYLLLVLAILLLPALAGLARRSRVSARMSREAQLLAERDAARADRAVAVEQERVRIARDMHDIVAHSLAVVIAQADGARYALGTNPGVADEALSTISATSRRALGDVRELLGALRHEQGTAPTPDVDDIDRLVADMRGVGLRVDVVRHGDPSELPTSTQLAVYRIVQESLTNAFKHGDRDAPVRVTIDSGPDITAIDVVNRRAADGRSGPGTGHGLVGMRERTAISGGTMTAGPRDGDFAVSVRIPRVGTGPRATVAAPVAAPVAPVTPVTAAPTIPGVPVTASEDAGSRTTTTEQEHTTR